MTRPAQPRVELAVVPDSLHGVTILADAPTGPELAERGKREAAPAPPSEVAMGRPRIQGSER